MVGYLRDTVDGSEILHQLRLVVYPIIYRLLAPSRVVVWNFFHQQYLQSYLRNELPRNRHFFSRISHPPDFIWKKTNGRFLSGPSLLEKILSDNQFSERDAAAAPWGDGGWLGLVVKVVGCLVGWLDRLVFSCKVSG